MALSSRSIEICLSRKRHRQFQGREDVRCYKHHSEGWCVLADGIYHVEDGRKVNSDNLEDIARMLGITPNKENIEAIFYIGIIKKDYSLDNLREAFSKIRGYQRLEVEEIEDHFLTSILKYMREAIYQ